MLSFREIQNCEGYYYNVQTEELLRNVGPGETRCWTEGSWRDTVAATDPDTPQFELLTPDVLMPLQAVQRLVADRYSRTAARLINRQTAVQPDGSVITEEAALREP